MEFFEQVLIQEILAGKSFKLKNWEKKKYAEFTSMQHFSRGFLFKKYWHSGNYIKIFNDKIETYFITSEKPDDLINHYIIYYTDIAQYRQTSVFDEAFFSGFW